MTDGIRNFHSGRPAAAALRNRLLESLSAEPGWTFGNHDDDVVAWLSGPCETQFVIEPAGEHVPRLGVLHVFTHVALVHDLSATRSLVADLNLVTTMNRWVLLGDPGPLSSELTALGADDRQLAEYGWRRNEVPQPLPGDAGPLLVYGCSFVVGADAIELPFDAVVLTVREQLARATAVVTVTDWDEEAWGTPVPKTSPDGTVRTAENWSRVLWHYEDFVAPYRDDDPGPLMDALVVSFKQGVEEQYEQGDGSAWFGNHDDAHLVCEVPYGPGPFARGAVSYIVQREVVDNIDRRTSLIRCSLVDNPVVGSGLLVTMQVPSDGLSYEPTWWKAHLLNSQNRLKAFAGADPGAAHGLGAWADRSGEVVFCSFVPSGWATLLSEVDLHSVFATILSNLARLSWSARNVLEDDGYFGTSVDPGTNRHSSGLASGGQGRGSVFGEPLLGSDPGAVILGLAVDHLVGDDVDWALLDEDDRGFSWWPNTHRQTIAVRRCSCEQEGAIVTISTDLATDLDDNAVGLSAALAAEPRPFAITIDESGSLSARAALHVHDNMVPSVEYWPAPIAVAQSLLAEQIDEELSGHLRPMESAPPEHPLRPDRDGILELFESPGWVPATPSEDDLGTISLAALLTLSPPAGAWWDGDEADWDFLTPPISGTSEALTMLNARICFTDPPKISRSYQLRSAIVNDEPDEPAQWCLEANERLIHGANDVAAISAFGFDTELSLTTLGPTALIGAKNQASRALFLATIADCHYSASSELSTRGQRATLNRDPQSTLAESCVSLLDFHRRALDIDERASLTASIQGDVVVARFERPWTSAVSDTAQRPRLARTGHQQLVSTVVINPTDPTPGLHLLHLVLLGASRSYERHGTGIAALLSSLARPFSTPEFQHVYSVLEAEDRVSYADGSWMIANDRSVPVPLTIVQDVDHPSWVSCTMVYGDVPSGTPGLDLDTQSDEQTCVGEWSADEAVSRYAVCLPPAALASVHQIRRVELMLLICRSVTDQVARVLT